MKKNILPDFIVIDDDPLNNELCTQIIQLTFSKAVVNTFTDPQEGLDYIQATYADKKAGKAILFLDINMPVLNGWDVLCKFHNFPDVITERVKIFILSSSINILDKEKALGDSLVADYISKPLVDVKLQDIFLNKARFIEER